MKTRDSKSYPEYLTTGVIAKYCGVSKVTVLRWIKQGVLTAFKIPGGHNRIHRDDFYAFAIISLQCFSGRYRYNWMRVLLKAQPHCSSFLVDGLAINYASARR